MATSNAPSHNVYTVEERGEGEDPFWLKIGATWAHKDAKGFNITLSALPPDNRLVLRVPAEDGDEAKNGDKPAAKETRKRRR